MGTWAGEPQLPRFLEVLLLLPAADRIGCPAFWCWSLVESTRHKCFLFIFLHLFSFLVVIFVFYLFPLFFMMEKQTKEFLDFKGILETQPLMLQCHSCLEFAIREVQKFTLAEDVSHSVQIHSNLWHIWKAVAINLLKLPLLLCYTSPHFHAHCSPTLSFENRYRNECCRNEQFLIPSSQDLWPPPIFVYRICNTPVIRKGIMA